jgi:hypothetical protein
MAGMYMVNRSDADLNAPAEILGIEVILSGARGRFWMDMSMVVTALTGPTELSGEVVGAVRDLIAGRTSEHVVRCFVGLPAGVLDPASEVGSFAAALQGCMVEPDTEEYEQVMAEARERNRDSAWRTTFHARAASDFRNFCNGLITEADELQPALRALGLSFDDDEVVRMTVDELELVERPWREVMGALFAVIVAHEASCHESTYAVDVLEHLGDGGLPVAAMREFLDSRLICLTPSGTVERPGFAVRPAARLSGDTPAINALRTATRAGLAEFFRIAQPEATTPAARQRVCTMVSDEWDPAWPAMVAGTGLLADPADVAWMAEDDADLWSPFVVADTFLYTRISGALPGWPTLVDLDEPLDVDAWIRGRFVAETRSGGLWPARTEELQQISENLAPHYDWAFDKRDFKVVTSLREETEAAEADGKPVPPPVELVAEMVARCGNLLGRLGVGLDGLRLGTDDEVRHHDDRPSAWIEALDGRTGRWQAHRDLAPHQAQMVAGVLAIETAPLDNGAGAVFITGTDPTRGLGSDGAASMLRALADLGYRSVVSTPDAVAHRAPQAREVRLVRDGSGVGSTATPSIGGPLRDVADRLGIEPIEALSAKSVVAAVPTEADRLVLEVLLNGDRAFDRVLVETGGHAERLAALRSDLVCVKVGDVVGLLGIAGDHATDLGEEELQVAARSLDVLPDGVVELLSELAVQAELAVLDRGLDAGVSQQTVTGIVDRPDGSATGGEEVDEGTGRDDDGGTDHDDC